MKKITYRILVAVVFLAGLSLLLYPFVANKWNTYRQERLISSYEEVVSEKTASGTINYDGEWLKAQQYNDELMPMILPDSFAIAEADEGEDEEYMAALNLAGDGIMGTVDIPKIGIKLPIYHTTDEEVLEKAAGHLEGSSLPIGGESTHCVITAHNGLVRAKMFTELDQLEEGDTFSLSILDRVLTYEVDQVLVAMPTDIEALSIVEGQDYVTLYTCTPTGVNTHRLLVRGHRIPTPEAEEEAASSPETSSHSGGLSPVLPAVGALAVFAALAVGLMDRLRKRRGAAYQPKRLRGTAPKKSKGHSDRTNQKRQKTGGPDKPPERKDQP